MKLGVLSDIHDHLANLEKAFALFKKEKVSRVVFCGDLSAPFTVSHFKKLKLPVWAVFGNNEGDRVNILRQVEKLQPQVNYAPKQGLMWQLTWEGKKIAVYHGHQQEITDNLVNSGLFDLVLTGHTHQPQIKKVGQTLWVNPGCVCGWTGLDAKPTTPSVATVDLTSLTAQLHQL